MSLTIELPSQEEQTALNLQRWAELADDPEVARWTGRVETDRHGHLLMSPPASFDHGSYERAISALLERLLPHGIASVECPISTPDGVRAADAAWISGSKLTRIGRKICLTEAPEICIEILSPRNPRREMAEKKALCFAAGADEVWFCDAGGRMTFFLGAESVGGSASTLCPAFPAVVAG